MSRRVVTSMIILLLFSGLSVAQTITGTMVGTLRDESRAILPGVEITVLHVQTNKSLQFVTDETGTYRASLLPPGEYSVTASLPGFRTEVRTGIALQVDQIARVGA